MNFVNSTKNQHYVSQVEQRLNTSTPSATPKRQKIHAFSVTDRKQYIITPSHSNGKLIDRNLSFYDLFSFDIASKETRSNFEALFQTYEHDIETQTRSLLKKLDAGSNEIKDELINLFAAKLLNSFRNPHCIKKTLNSIGTIATYTPLDPNLAEICTQVENGRRPHQKHLCGLLGITNKLYAKWLRTLFMLLMRPGDTNMLEQLIKSLYENTSHHLGAFVYTYAGEHADKHPLLSDKGFSSPSDNDACLVYSFNLSSNAFISYTFIDVEKQALVNVPEIVIQHFKMHPKTINITHRKNDLEALNSYNKNTVYQAKSSVFCCSKSVYGVTVVS